MRAVVIAILMVSGVARADGVGVIVVGEPTLQAPVRAHIKAWLSQHKRTVVDAPFDSDHERTFADCFVIEDIKCATGSFAKNARADHVVFARIDLVAGEAREATVTAYWFAKHHDPVAEKRACKGCDEAALQRTVASLLDALARMVEPPKVPERTVAHARGMARVGPALVIGGGAAALVGAAGFLYYGRKGGSDEPYEYPNATATGTILSIAGAAAMVGGALWWRTTAKVEHPRFVAPALVAVGVGALVGGTIALSYGAKRGPDEVFVYDNATEVGAPLAIIGGGAVIAGVVLWLFDRGPSGTPMIGAIGDTKMIGWMAPL